MTIYTRSKFYYDYIITDANNILAFNDGGGEVEAVLGFGQYTPTDLAIEVARAMNVVGLQSYNCSFNRQSRLFTISSISNFSLLIQTGVNVNKVFSTLGFTGSDLSSSTSYTSSNVTGKAFLPQYLLQEYVDFEDQQQFASGTVKKTATGEVEVVSFGQENFSDFNITYATNEVMQQGSPIENDQSGVENLRDFMKYAIKKGPFEFMPDRDNENTFTKALLEKTPESTDGIAYKLKELYGKGLVGYFETGIIKLRKL